MTSDPPAKPPSRPTKQRQPGEGALAEATLLIHGLGCPHCIDRITRALERVDGARHATMDYDSRIATVTYDPTRTDPRIFIHAVILEGEDRGQTFDADLLAIHSLHPDDLYPS